LSSQTNINYPTYATYFAGGNFTYHIHTQIKTVILCPVTNFQNFHYNTPELNGLKT